MPKNESEVTVQDWLSTGFKALIVVIFTVATAAVTQLNGNISGLTAQLKVMEAHQVEADKHIAAIEISREVNMESYKKVVNDVQDMKTQMLQNTMRLQTIADFVAKHVK